MSITPRLTSIGDLVEPGIRKGMDWRQTRGHWVRLSQDDALANPNHFRCSTCATIWDAQSEFAQDRYMPTCACDYWWPLSELWTMRHG